MGNSDGWPTGADDRIINNGSAFDVVIYEHGASERGTRGGWALCVPQGQVVGLGSIKPAVQDQASSHQWMPSGYCGAKVTWLNALGEPWCASFVTWVELQAGDPTPFRSATVGDWLRAATAGRYGMSLVSAANLCVGDLVAFKKYGGWQHMGIISSVGGDPMLVSGNTTGRTRRAEGVYEKAGVELDQARRHGGVPPQQRLNRLPGDRATIVLYPCLTGLGERGTAMRTRVVAVVAVMGLTLGLPALRADASGTAVVGVGSAGLGDRFFPLAGNGGYDVAHYDLDLSWDPTSGELRGEAGIEATATQRLDRFNLDLRAFTVTSVTVNDRPARFTREGQELTITPARRVGRGEELEVVVRYRGVPETVIDPDGAVDGWIPTDDGALVLSEPQGSPSWFPVNDYPTDKATFTVSVTVPRDLTVLGNGLPESPQRRGPLTTYTWREKRPMAAYLATIAIGHFDVTTSRTSSGLPIIVGVDQALAADSAASLARIGEMTDWEASLFGPYPFESVGAIVKDAPDVGYALETQTRPVFTSTVDDSTLVHELAHQWFGDSVALTAWPEMWLNEGFATYVEWLWSEREGGPTPAALADEAYDSKPADDPFWTVAPGPDTLPEPADLFSEPVYLRGAMTLQALRTEVGDTAFFRILRRWAQTNRDGNVSTRQFIAFAEKVSGHQLDDLFTTWLSTPSRPAAAPAPVAATATVSASAARSVDAHGGHHGHD